MTTVYLLSPVVKFLHTVQAVELTYFPKRLLLLLINLASYFCSIMVRDVYWLKQRLGDHIWARFLKVGRGSGLKRCKVLYTKIHSYIKPLCCWWLIWPIQNDAKNLKNYWNPGKWVLIWEYSVRAIQWVPTWQGLNGFQRFLRLCTLDESSLSMGRVKPWH